MFVAVLAVLAGCGSSDIMLRCFEVEMGVINFRIQLDALIRELMHGFTGDRISLVSMFQVAQVL